MGKKVSNDDRRKMVEKFGQTSVEKKKKKLKHPPKPKKEENPVSCDTEDNGLFCKKIILPKVKIGQNILGVKGDKKPKKIRIIPPKPIHIGQSVL